MAPRVRGGKGKAVVQESGAQNIPGNDGVVQERRGRPTGNADRNVIVEVDQLANQVNDMELVVTRFQNLHPPSFYGNEGSEKAEAWLRAITNLFNLINYDSDRRLNLVILQLKETAERWWQNTYGSLLESERPVTWDVFCSKFRQEYAPPSFSASKTLEFFKLVQGDLSVAEYARQLSSLLTYVPHIAASDEIKLEKFLEGLNQNLFSLVLARNPVYYADAVYKAIRQEAGMRRGIPQYAFQAPSGGAQYSENASSFVPQQSFQQPRPQWFNPKGKQFKKKSFSSSSSSGSNRGGGSVGFSRESCNRCGGRHSSDQCIEVQGFCRTCGLQGHYARVCLNAGGHQYQTSQTSQFPRVPAPRSFTPQFAPRPSFSQPRGPPQQQFPGPQQARVHALTHDRLRMHPEGLLQEPHYVFISFTRRKRAQASTIASNLLTEKAGPLKSHEKVRKKASLKKSPTRTIKEMEKIYLHMCQSNESRWRLII